MFKRVAVEKNDVMAPPIKVTVHRIKVAQVKKEGMFSGLSRKPLYSTVVNRKKSFFLKLGFCLGVCVSVGSLAIAFGVAVSSGVIKHFGHSGRIELD